MDTLPQEVQNIINDYSKPFYVGLASSPDIDPFFLSPLYHFDYSNIHFYFLEWHKYLVEMDVTNEDIPFCYNIRNIRKLEYWKTRK